MTATGEFNHVPNGAGGMQHQVLEEENERLTENLRGKVQALKSVSVFTLQLFICVDETEGWKFGGDL